MAPSAAPPPPIGLRIRTSGAQGVQLSAWARVGDAAAAGCGCPLPRPGGLPPARACNGNSGGGTTAVRPYGAPTTARAALGLTPMRIREHAIGLTASDRDSREGACKEPRIPCRHNNVSSWTGDPFRLRRVPARRTGAGVRKHRSPPAITDGSRTRPNFHVCGSAALRRAGQGSRQGLPPRTAAGRTCAPPDGPGTRLATRPGSASCAAPVPILPLAPPFTRGGCRPRQPPSRLTTSRPIGSGPPDLAPLDKSSSVPANRPQPVVTGGRRDRETTRDTLLPAARARAPLSLSLDPAPKVSRPPLRRRFARYARGITVMSRCRSGVSLLR